MVNIFVFRRLFAASLVVAVAAYATLATAAAERFGGRAEIGAGSNQPALCPVTRPSLQMGRQADGRPGLPLACVVGLPAQAPDFDLSPGWVGSERIEAVWTVADVAQFSPRITRGPPGLAS